MSARAAWRLETIGFKQPYRYQPGKDDWLCAGLPLEGRSAAVERAFHVARRDVPTCGLHEQVGDAARLVESEGWPLAVVVNEQRIVLGRLRPQDLEANPAAVAGKIMVEGPRTVRGSLPVKEIGAWLDERKVPGVLITTADGELVGYLRHDEVEARYFAKPS